MSQADNGQKRLPEKVCHYSVVEVAEMLSVGKKAVRKLIHDRKLTAVRVNNVLRVPEASLVTFLVENRCTARGHGTKEERC